MANPSDLERKGSWAQLGVKEQPNDASSKHDVESQSDPKMDSLDAATDDQVQQDPNIVDWDGSDDPENPMNWSSSKKIAAIGIVSAITMLSYVFTERLEWTELTVDRPLASTVIAPAVPEVMATFQSTNETLGAFVTSVYILGYAFGPLFIAPLSELYGRSIVYNVCNFMFLIFSIACALANNMSALIVFRLLAGIAASSPMTLGPGTIADVVPLEKRGMAMAAYIMGPLIGPTCGPLSGCFILVFLINLN
jgi:MFS family permease